MQHLWLSDCRSLVDHLHNPTLNTVSDKRLSIDLIALRQIIWQTDEPEMREHLSLVQPDIIRWIDTSAMLCDCLAKSMKADTLIKAMRDGVLNLAATDASIIQKMKKQKHRRATEDEENHGD